ncbi:2OG-Fe(II) oxygenase [Aquabacterium sp.]|uniref:2OG-Fe(II) oxygenase n=1 Tax=Aquabacterium sp. TaxID=1872578 RepID=UPI0025BB660B|nr:2OG-Fe(II) oxygenase [Aquabacterium sp.]
MPDIAPATLTIRGRTLKLNELLDARLNDPDYLDEMRLSLKQAQPFPHLVAKGWFHSTLLELISEEFEKGPADTLKVVEGQHESHVRSVVGAELGPATQAYFNVINSGHFIRRLSYISGVDNLIADPHLFGGGLHETRHGGHFGVHRDFDRHLRTGLNNEMVFITYLNKNWDTAWHGELELWDKEANVCVKKVAPEFGNTLILPHGPISYHGHPTPLATPPGVTRRSVAAYYYRNLHAHEDRALRETSLFLHEPPAMPIQRTSQAKRLIRSLTPPIIWDALSRMKNSG